MIFGDPYRFAILVEYIPYWNLENEQYYNGLFHYSINGCLFPEILKTATLSVDIITLIDKTNALVSFPENKRLFSLPAKEAFNEIYQITYPESTDEDEYPDSDFTYYAATENLSNDCIFAVADGENIRILAAKTSELVKNEAGDGYHWEDKNCFDITEIVISKGELIDIIDNVKKYYFSLSKD